VKFSRAFALLVALLTAISPLLACLPNSAMTPAEMECCKKMAGNCDMGGGNHKCCDMTANHSAPAAAVTQNSTPHAFIPCVLSGVVDTEATLPQYVERIRASLIQMTSSPPGSPTILRI
jgi:hypothetical protein